MERVAAFMQKRVDVSLGACRIHEDKRHALLAKARAVAAWRLAPARLEVEQTLGHHMIEERAELLVDLVENLAAAFGKLFTRFKRLKRNLGVGINLNVPRLKHGDTELAHAFVMKLRDNGHD